MKKDAKAIFWTLLIGLILFIIAFATPFLSIFTSGQVLAAAGCDLGTWDSPAKCPPGSFAERFVPFHVFFLFSVLAPLTFVKQLGDITLVWGLITLVAAFFAAEKSGKH
jgi:hypothetical protein